MPHIVKFLGKVAFCLVFLGLVFSNSFVLAQNVPPGRAINLNEIIDLTQSIGGFLYVIGSVLAGIVIILSGIMYVMARGDAAKVKNAKDTLKGGLIGAVIIFSFGLIVNTLQAFVANPFTFFGF